MTNLLDMNMKKTRDLRATENSRCSFLQLLSILSPAQKHSRDLISSVPPSGTPAAPPSGPGTSG